ncbi:MAG: hypothetical protein BGO14_10065 [Chlamydiales bacterium 38-26]|nr:hypothetical protein [Chlamydiales bacterium]OJV11310.1 MAG: hypothetical protein BGO14_10065 [Chlamydiales bacterium 38-26]
MTAIFFSILAALSAALSNLFFRINSQKTASTNQNPSGYLLFFYFTCFVLTFSLYPQIFYEKLSYLMLAMGVAVGILNILLMTLTSRALQKGPAGLTFAFQNTSAVFPGMILFMLFGTEYGFTFSFPKLIGILLVIYGLFVGAKNESSSSSKTSSIFQWLKYAVACFGVQVFALTLIQARCIFCPAETQSPAVSSGLASCEDICFMLGQFGAAFLIQLIYHFSQMQFKLPKLSLYGTLGGFSNFASTCMLLLATKWAMPYEKGILFPCFAVATIIACNTWANRLYGEKFNLSSNATCACGVLLGLVA